MFYGIKFLDPKDNFYIMTLALIGIFIAWFVVFTREASAPPIVIDNTFTRKEQTNKLLTATGGNTDNPVKNSTGLVSTQFPETGSYGKSGFAFAGLGQPCITEDTDNTVPNLPVSYTTQTCDKSKGLECVTGIYQGTNENQGGGICLKIVNQSCQIKSDCSPAASFCLNNLCQTRDEVINKSCANNKDCTGDLNDFNHVCDPDSKRCVFNIWPKDSGCTSNTQCLHYSKYPEAVTCLTSDPSNGNGYLVKIDGIYQGTSIVVDSGSISTLNSLEPKNLVKSYVEVFDTTTDLTEGRFLIKNITNNNITLDSIFSGSQGVSYSLEFGTDQDGICLIDFPLGAPPSNIEGTKEKYPCIDGLQSIKVGNQTYCIENKNVRSTRVGSLEQVCTSDINNLSCEPGLCCTFDNSLISNFGSLIDSYHVVGGVSIGGQLIKDIGRCKKQEKSKFETCNDNCIKPYFCLEESDINDNVFNYCTNDWDVMDNVSILTGCPDSYFEFSGKDNSFCKNKPRTFCFNNDDCTSNNVCGKTIPSTKEYINNLYDPEKGWYRKNDNHFSIVESKNPKLLTSNQYFDTSTPTFLSYVIKNNETSWSVFYSLTGDISSSNNTLTVNFEETPLKEPVFSVFQKQDKTHQLNIEFIEEYENNRRRFFRNQQGDDFYYSGLTEGTSVYIENFEDILNISFGAPYTQGLAGGGIEILKFKDSEGNEVNNPYRPMTTYSNKFGCNFTSDSIVFRNHAPTLQNGDRFTYVKGGTGNSISYLNNGGYTELTEGTCYYSYAINTGVSQSQTIGHVLYLTDDFDYTNFNPKFGSSTLTNFGTSVIASSSFNPVGNSYLQLQKLYGYRILPITIPKSGENKTLTINQRKDYISGDLFKAIEPCLNVPIGYFSDTENIKADIGVSSILLSYNYGKNINQVLNLSYTITTNNINQSNYKHNSKIETADGTSYVINYNIVNSFSPPNLRVISNNYNQEYPYDLDEVRYFENNNSDSNDTVNFLSTYQNITPTDPRSSIANISKLRKLNFTTNFFKQGGGYEFDVKYQGLDTSIAPIEPSDNPPTIPFGSSFYVSLSEIKQSLLSSGNSSQNIFLGGSDVILFKNQKDIDVILKYGAVDLVIGYNGIKNAIAIVNIKEYNIDSKGIQTLEVQVSTYLNFGDKLNEETSPKLYINNIYPMSTIHTTSSTSVNDGRILISSCVPNDYFAEENSINYQVQKTSYNKILTLAKRAGESNITTYSYFDYYQLIDPAISTFNDLTSSSIFFHNQDKLSTIIHNFINSQEDYSFKITAYLSSSNLNDNYIYICNNKFLSLTSISSSSLVYLNNQSYYSTFSVIGKYYSKNKNKEIVKVSGNIRFKNDTHPFYTQINGNSGLLDESYLKEISWPYWIKNLNTGSINIDRIFLSWNPGNMENNMFYYCFVTINNVKMLLYLSTNFTVNDIKESQPVPIVIDSFDTISKNLKMLPYNKNILILSKYCVPN